MSDISEVSRPLYDILVESLQDASMNHVDDLQSIDRDELIDEWIEILKDYKASDDYRAIYTDELHELEMYTEDEIRDIGNQLYDIL